MDRENGPVRTPNTAERAMADACAGWIKCARGDIRTGIKLSRQALDLGRKLGDQVSIGRASITLMFYLRTPSTSWSGCRLRKSFFQGLHTGTRPGLFVPTMQQWIMDTFLAIGQRKRAEEVLEKVRIQVVLLKNLSNELMLSGRELAFAVMDGHLEKALNMAESIQSRAKEAGLAEIGKIYTAFSLFRARLYSGTSIEAIENEVSVLDLTPKQYCAWC